MQRTMIIENSSSKGRDIWPNCRPQFYKDGAILVIIFSGNKAVAGTIPCKFWSWNLVPAFSCWSRQIHTDLSHRLRARHIAIKLFIFHLV